MSTSGTKSSGALGPAYPYYKYVNSPSDMGMSSKGTMDVLGKDIDGLNGYIEMLVEGTGSASATGNPLGNKFFMKTKGKCNDTATNDTVDRYIYVNNVPTGNIPFISSGASEGEFKGLIPGILGDLNAFNPVLMFDAFTSGTQPDCQQITMETIDNHNEKSIETNYVTVNDIKEMNACTFPDGKNPATGEQCKESFSNQINTFLNGPQDKCGKAYMASLSILGIYILYRVLAKNGVIPSAK